MSFSICPGQDPRFLKAQDVAEVKCPECGRLVEFWPDELVRECSACGRRFTNPEQSMNCLNWCRYAAQCLAAIRGESSTVIGPLREELIERMKHVFADHSAKVEHNLPVLKLAEQIGRPVGKSVLHT